MHTKVWGGVFHRKVNKISFKLVWVSGKCKPEQDEILRSGFQSCGKILSVYLVAYMHLVPLRRLGCVEK